MDTKLQIDEYNQQGRTFFSCDKYKEAIEVYKKAIALDQMNIRTYFNMGESYIMLDEYEEAKNAINKVLLIDKTNGEAYFHLGNIELLLNNYDAGSNYYAKALNHGYDDPQMYMNLASIEEDNGDLEKAVDFYNKAIARDKNLVEARIRKIEIYIMVKKYAQSLQAAENLIELKPQIFEGHHYKFVSLVHLNKYDEAEKALAFAEKLFPDDQGFIFDRVKLLELQGEFERALKLMEEKIDIAPKEVIANEKAQLLLALDRLSEAEDVIKAQLSAEKSTDLLFTLIIINLEKNEYSSLLDCAEDIINEQEFEAKYFAALYYKALALKKLGKIAEAAAAYTTAAQELQRACSISGGLLDLYVYRAICYKELKDYDRAMEMVEYVLNLDDSIGEVYMVRAAIYEDLNRAEDAERDRETALTKSQTLSKLLG